MSEISYRPLIEDMVWSSSRISCFRECPYRWFLKYLCDCEATPQFYASYGSFMHRILERYFKGFITAEQAKTEFLLGFREEVSGRRPSPATVAKYIKSGSDYLGGLQPFPYNTVDVEKKMYFAVGGNPFVCIVDYIGEKDGEFYIVDHKSRDLKPRSKRKKPTQNDRDLDEMLGQLYLYAEAVRQHYGKYPKLLCFNCFKAGTFIEEPFDLDRHRQEMASVAGTIEEIKNTDDFYPVPDFFACYHICDRRDSCCYWEMR